MGLSVFYASRDFLNNHPLIEDLFTYLIFRANYNILSITDETNLFHFSEPEKISETLFEIFAINVPPTIVLKEYTTIAWLEKEYKISQVEISQEILNRLKKAMDA